MLNTYFLPSSGVPNQVCMKQLMFIHAPIADQVSVLSSGSSKVSVREEFPNVCAAQSRASALPGRQQGERQGTPHCAGTASSEPS